MRIGLMAALSCLVLISGVTGQRDALAAKLGTGFNVDIRRFAGTWYELARRPNRFQDTAKQRGGKVYSACYNTKIEHFLAGPQKLRIKNSCMRRSREGDVFKDTVDGVASVKEQGGARILQIAFGSGFLRGLQRLMGAEKDYSIYCLGPINKSGRYDWAIVGAMKNEFVFLLTRVKEVPGRIRSRMLSCARKVGLPVGQLIFRQH